MKCECLSAQCNPFYADEKGEREKVIIYEGFRINSNINGDRLK